MNNLTKHIIGCEEWCSFPGLNIPAIKARIDSGAKTSSIHAVNIKPFTQDDKTWVSFEITPLQFDRCTRIECQAEVLDKRNVKNSFGITEKRYFIKTQLQLGEHCFEVELSLSNRASMEYRMLLGREAMLGRFMVDPELKFSIGHYAKAELDRFYKKSIVKPTGLNIGLLASNEKLYSNKRIIEAIQERNHLVRFLNLKNCFMKLDAKTPEIYTRDGKLLKDLDAVIPRIKPSLTFYGAALIRQFESLGIFSLNSSQSIIQSRDKLFSLQLLNKNNLDIPTSGFANSPHDTESLIDMVGGAPLIIKLLEGTQGTGVVLAETKKAAESVINAMKSLKANLIVQEFIKESNGSDFRCFVIDGRVIASMERKAKPGEFRANIHKGGKPLAVKITPNEKKMVLKAVKTLGLLVAGVDFIRSERGPLLLEINSSPGLEGIEAVTGKDIATEIVLAIEKKLEFSK